MEGVDSLAKGIPFDGTLSQFVFMGFQSASTGDQRFVSVGHQPKAFGAERFGESQMLERLPPLRLGLMEADACRVSCLFSAAESLQGSFQVLLHG